MSGKRILDAVALFNASRKVAAKHFDIRLSQVKLYGQTSSIVKALRAQGAPSIAATAARFASSQSPPKSSQEGIQQDHFYNRSTENSTSDTPPTEEINVEQVQAERNPLPDGTIPPQGSPIGQEINDGITFNKRPVGETAQHPVNAKSNDELSVKSSNQSSIPDPTSKPLSSEQARRLQRQSEDQIPSRSAEPPSEATSEDFGIEQEQDVFYQPPGTAKPVLSALPRLRVPKTENDIQEGDSHIPSGINADVYYSGAKHGEGADEPTEEQLSKLFHSPKNAKLFAQKGKYAPGGVSARKFHTSRVVREKTSDTDTGSIKQLAADMAKDAQKSSVSDFGRKFAISTDQLTDVGTPNTYCPAVSNARIESPCVTRLAAVRVRRTGSINGIRCSKRKYQPIRRLQWVIDAECWQHGTFGCQVIQDERRCIEVRSNDELSRRKTAPKTYP